MAINKHLNDSSLYIWSLLRVGIGLIFLWAFFDKLFGLGFSTCRDKSGGINYLCSDAWLKGGSPTSGFLGHAVSGPFADFYHKLAGNSLIDWAFMLGLLAVGVGLTIGIWIRAAAVVGVLMLILMWGALLWPQDNPVIDEHIVYIIALFGVFTTSEHAKWSLQGWWRTTSIANSIKLLR